MSNKAFQVRHGLRVGDKLIINSAGDWVGSPVPYLLKTVINTDSFSTNKTISIYDSGETDHVDLSHDGTNVLANFTNTNRFRFRSLASGVTVEDGAWLRIFDSGNTDYAEFSHDSTDFNTSFSNTTNWVITGLSGNVRIGSPSYRVLTEADFGSPSLTPSLDQVTSAGNLSLNPIRIQYDDDDGYQLLVEPSTVTSNDAIVEIRGHRNRPSAGTQVAQLKLTNFDAEESGSPINIDNPAGVQDLARIVSEAVVSSNDILAAQKLSFYYRVGSPTVTGSPQGTASLEEGMSLYDGEFRVYDSKNKNSNRYLSQYFDKGNNNFYTTFGGSPHGYGWYFGGFERVVNFLDTSDTIIFQIFSDPSVARVNVTNGSDFEVRSGGSLLVRNSGNTDYAEFSHNGTDFNTAFTNTTDWNLTGGINLKLFDSGGTDYMTFSHNGTDFTLAGTNTTDLNINSVGLNINSIYRTTTATGTAQTSDGWVRIATNTASAGRGGCQIWVSHGGGTGAPNTMMVDVSASWDSAAPTVRIFGTPVGTGISDIRVAYDTNSNDKFVDILSGVGSSVSYSVVVRSFVISGTGWEAEFTKNPSPGSPSDPYTVEISDITYLGGNYTTVWGTYVRPADGGSIVFATDATANESQLALTGGSLLSVWDSTNTDSGTLSHDGTDFIIDCANTTDLNVTGITGYIRTGSNIGMSFGAGGDLYLQGGFVRIRDSGATDYAQFSHDGTDFNVACTNTTDFNITGADVSLEGLYVSKEFSLSTDVEDQLTADQSDYTPTGWDTATMIGLNTDGSNYTIDGLGDGTQVEGMVVIIQNFDGSNSITLADSSNSSSSAANRFICPYGEDFVLGPKESVTLVYKTLNTFPRWRVISNSKTHLTTGEIYDQAYQVTSQLLGYGTSSQNIVHYDYPQVAAYNSSSSSVSGAFRIAMPNGTANNTMWHIIVRGYEYNSTNGMWAVSVAGYDYNGGSQWNNQSAQIIYGNPSFDVVRFLYGASDTMYIQLGETTDTHNYPKVWVEVASALHTNTTDTDYVDQWAITLETSEAGLTADGVAYLLGVRNPIDSTTMYLYGKQLTTYSFLDGLSVRFYDSGNTDYASFSHDGTDFNTTLANTADWNITGSTTVKINADLYVQGGNNCYIYDSGNNDFLSINHTGTQVTIVASGTDTGAVPIDIDAGNNAITLSSNSTVYFQTQTYNGTGTTSAAQIKDHGGTLQDIGFNILPTFNFNASDTLEAQHCGHMTGKTNTSAYTLTGPTSSDVDFPVGGVCTIANFGTSTDYSLADTATCTMYVCDGSSVTDISGGATIAPGGIVTLYRYSTTAIYLFGSGLTA